MRMEETHITTDFLVEIVATLLLLLATFLLLLHLLSPPGLTLLIGRCCSLLVLCSHASLSIAHLVPFSAGFFSSLLEFIVDILWITNKSRTLLTKLDCTRLPVVSECAWVRPLLLALDAQSWHPSRKQRDLRQIANHHLLV